MGEFWKPRHASNMEDEIKKYSEVLDKMRAFRAAANILKVDERKRNQRRSKRRKEKVHRSRSMKKGRSASRMKPKMMRSKTVGDVPPSPKRRLKSCLKKTRRRCRSMSPRKCVRFARALSGVHIY